MLQLICWVVIKQSTNLELKTQFLTSKECENSHTLTTTTTGSKTSQKEVARHTLSNKTVDNNQLKCCFHQQAETC